MIGAGLAGMAAAARLAKARHQVTLVEQTDQLGGAWAATELDGRTVDSAPPIFAFPAPWRDLFRKSGRALEAEFARSGDELVPAGPARHLFADGTDFVLPIGRGDQHAAITEHFGAGPADRWRQLVDRFGEVWQALRPLGVEAELTDRSQLSKSVRSALYAQQSLADLARQLDHPVLSRIVLDLGSRSGSDPDRTPAFVAVQLYLDRTFGRWTAGSSTTMINSLGRRLQLRRVEVRTGVRATKINFTDGRVHGVSTDQGTIAAEAVVATCDPFQLYDQLLPGDVGRGERRRLHRLRPARAPQVSLQWRSAATGEQEPTETIHHRDDGGPRIDYTRPIGDAVLQISHDYGAAEPDPRAGLAWRGFRSWLNRPPVTSGVPGLFTAGPFSRGGNGPSQQVLSGALAAYGCQRQIAPDRPLEPR